MQHEDTAVTAAFVMEGMRSEAYMRAIQAYGHGALEMVQEVMECVPVLLALRQAVDESLSENDSYPGVYDYEVSASMGAWFATEIAERHAMPGRAEVIAEAKRLTRDFFVRDNDMASCGIDEAIVVEAARLLNPVAIVTHPVAGFTEGPWHVEPTDGNPNSLSIVKYGDGYIAEINRADDGLQPVDHADARLIAAAPSLYEALDRACTVHDENMSGGFDLLENEQVAYNAMCEALTLADGLPRVLLLED
jgi:hypothetical protein